MFAEIDPGGRVAHIHNSIIHISEKGDNFPVHSLDLHVNKLPRTHTDALTHVRTIRQKQSFQFPSRRKLLVHFSDESKIGMAERA